MNYEVEQKFRVDDHVALAARLSGWPVEWHAVVTQVDTYFAHPSRDFAQTDEALRIRRVGELNWITYKGPKIDAATKTRREIELPLPEGPQTSDDFHSLLAEFGFRRVAEVHKERRSARVAFQGRSFELALDRVDGVGTFAELELMAKAEELETAKACLLRLAHELGLDRVERRSYLEMLLAAT